MARLRLHLLHQPGALNGLGKARIVFDVRRDGQLTAGLDALNEGGFQHGARSIDRRRVTRSAAADDDDF